MKRTSKGIFGRILVIIGITLPLIGFLGMTWNNLNAGRAYRAYQADYEKKTAEIISIREEEIASYNENILKQEEIALIDPFTVEDYKGAYNLDSIGRDDIFAYLIIPKLDLARPVYLDASYSHLSKGVAQIDGTSLPVGGLNARSVIAGHRGWYNDVMFLYLDDLVEGDILYLDRGIEKLVYKVSDKEVIGPSDWDKLGPREGLDMLTLLTCHPFGPPRPYRLLVNCERVYPEVVSYGQDIYSAEVAEILEGDQVTSSTAKYMNMVIYGITLVLLIGLVVSLVKFAIYMKR